MAHQVADEARILAHLARAAAVGNPRRLHDRGVVPHVVDHPDEPVIEDGKRPVEQRLERRDAAAERGAGGFPLGRDLGLLLRGHGHGNPSKTGGGTLDRRCRLAGYGDKRCVA